jgi:hypothetical protein
MEADPSSIVTSNTPAPVMGVAPRPITFVPRRFQLPTLGPIRQARPGRAGLSSPTSSPRSPRSARSNVVNADQEAIRAEFNRHCALCLKFLGNTGEIAHIVSAAAGLGEEQVESENIYYCLTGCLSLCHFSSTRRLVTVSFGPDRFTTERRPTMLFIVSVF